MRHKHANRIDMTFKYTPASKTNIAATIAREKKRLAELERQQADAEAERVGKVAPIRKGRA